MDGWNELEGKRNNQSDLTYPKYVGDNLLKEPFVGGGLDVPIFLLRAVANLNHVRDEDDEFVPLCIRKTL